MISGWGYTMTGSGRYFTLTHYHAWYSVSHQIRTSGYLIGGNIMNKNSLFIENHEDEKNG